MNSQSKNLQKIVEAHGFYITERNGDALYGFAHEIVSTCAALVKDYSDLRIPPSEYHTRLKDYCGVNYE